MALVLYSVSERFDTSQSELLCDITGSSIFSQAPHQKKKGSIGEVGSVSIALRYSRAWVNESLNVVRLSSVPLLLEHALQRGRLASTDFNLGKIILVPVSGFLFLLAYGMLSD